LTPELTPNFPDGELAVETFAASKRSPEEKVRSKCTEMHENDPFFGPEFGPEWDG
jgi:hypothetical protein